MLSWFSWQMAAGEQWYLKCFTWLNPVLDEREITDGSVPVQRSCAETIWKALLIIPVQILCASRAVTREIPLILQYSVYSIHSVGPCSSGQAGTYWKEQIITSPVMLWWYVLSCPVLTGSDWWSSCDSDFETRKTHKRAAESAETVD